MPPVFERYDAFGMMKNKTVQLELSDHLIRIFYHGSLISEHVRKTKGNGYQTNPLDMPPKKEIDSMEWNPKRFISWAERIGPDTKKVIQKVLASKDIVQKTYAHCMAILCMENKFGSCFLEEACGAVEIPKGVAAYKALEEYLEMNQNNWKQIS